MRSIRSMSAVSCATYPESSWPSVSGHGVHQVRAPDFGDAGVLDLLVQERVPQRGDRWEQPMHDLLHGGDVHGGRERVVGRLGHVDVVVGVDRLLGAHDPAGELDGPVGDDLVGVHVGLRAAARLPDVQRELVVERTLGHLARCLLDQVGQRAIELAEVAVHRGGRALEKAEGPDQRLGHGLGADVEVVQRALRLRPPVPVGGNLDLPHAVAFDAGAGHESQLRTGDRTPRTPRTPRSAPVERHEGGLPGRPAALDGDRRHEGTSHARPVRRAVGTGPKLPTPTGPPLPTPPAAVRCRRGGATSPPTSGLETPKAPSEGTKLT